MPTLKRPDPIRGWAAHESFIAAARLKPEIWRLAVGSLLAIATGLALNGLLATIMSQLAPEFWYGEVAGTFEQGQTPGAMLVLLGTFGFFAAGVAMAVKTLHDRHPVTLLGPLRPAWLQFRTVLLMLALIGLVVMILPPYATSLETIPNPNLTTGQWIALLPLSLAAVLLQSGAEEILFRGYLQQQLAARFKSPLIWALLPSLVFALGHYSPGDMGESAILVTVWAAFFGLLMADLTARAGTLGPAIAVHFTNNISAILLMSATDSMSGLALFVSPAAMNDPDLLKAWLPVDFAAMVVAWLAARLAIRR